jgi:hypothetical protein
MEVLMLEALQAATNASHNSTTLLTDRSVYNATHFVLAGAYFVLTLFTLALVAFKYATGSLRETWKMGFFLFVILGSAMRGCWAVFDPMMLDNSIVISNRTDLFLNLFPSCLFFGCYIVLLMLWVELYHYPLRSGGGMRIHHLRVHLWFILGAMMGIFLVLFLIDALVFPSSYKRISTATNVVERILILYLASLYIITCVAFSVYGGLVLVPLCRKPERRRDTVLRILGLTMLIMLIFLVRAAMVFIGFFANWSIVSYFDLVYYFSCEILPIFFMFLILLWRTPGTQQQQQHNSPQYPSPVVHTSNNSDSFGSASDERSPLVKK